MTAPAWVFLGAFTLACLIIALTVVGGNDMRRRLATRLKVALTEAELEMAARCYWQTRAMDAEVTAAHMVARLAELRGSEFDARVAEAIALCGDDPRSSTPIHDEIAVERLVADLAAWDRGEEL